MVFSFWNNVSGLMKKNVTFATLFLYNLALITDYAP